MDDLFLALMLSMGAAFVQSVLLVVIIHRAGFVGIKAMMGFAPLIAFVSQWLIIITGSLTPSEAIVCGLPLALLPFLFLAFKRWPAIAAPAVLSEI